MNEGWIESMIAINGKRAAVEKGHGSGTYSLPYLRTAGSVGENTTLRTLSCYATNASTQALEKHIIITD